ncbi:carboxyl transferase domain-containing protein [Mycobacterium tuberculosis]
MLDEVVRRAGRAQTPQHQPISVKNARSATAWSPTTAPSTGATCASSARTPRCLAAAAGEVYGEKIVKGPGTGDQDRPSLSASTTVLARASRKVSSRWCTAVSFRNNILASGVIPQISLIMGAAAGEHVYSPP